MSHPIQPLLHDAGDRVLVYGQPICMECGHTIEAIGPDRWRHAAAGRTPSRPSKWLSPSINDLRACRTYEDFAARYPWAVRSSTHSVLATSLATSRGQWREGMSRLERYRLELAALMRRRSLAQEANPYRDLFEILAASPAEPEDPEEAAAITQQPTYWGLPYGLYQILGLRGRRQELVQVCAWAIPNQQALTRSHAMRRFSIAVRAWGTGPRCSRQRAWTPSPTTCIHRVAERRTRSIGGSASRGPR